jgi:hypothetical protein
VLVGSSFNMEEKWKKTFGLFKEALDKHGENAFEGTVASFAEGRKWEREKMSGSNLNGAIAQFAEICEKGHLGICVGICEHLCVFKLVSQSIARA